MLIKITSYGRCFSIFGLILFYITQLHSIISSYGCAISLVDKHLSIHIGLLDYFLFIVAYQITNGFFIILRHNNIWFLWSWVKKLIYLFGITRLSIYHILCYIIVLFNITIHFLEKYLNIDMWLPNHPLLISLIFDMPTYLIIHVL